MWKNVFQHLNSHNTYTHIYGVWKSRKMQKKKKENQRLTLLSPGKAITQLRNVVPNPDRLVERLMTSEGKKSDSGSLKPVFPNQRWMRGNLEQLHVTIGGSSDHSEERSLNTHQTQPLSSVASSCQVPKQRFVLPANISALQVKDSSPGRSQPLFKIILSEQRSLDWTQGDDPQGSE